MTAKEAKAMLARSPFQTSEKRSRINKGLTCAQSHEIVCRHIDTLPDDQVLDFWEEKRVLQVSQNRVRV